MPLRLGQFVRQIEDSGILAAETLREFLPPQATPRDADDLLRELLRQRKLTRFQADELAQGNVAALVLGNYILLEKIGAGGMGQVFKARHRVMERTVAIKVLPAKTMSDPAAIARFEREVRAAARLNHPNIVTAYDADCAGDVHFLVMECVDGSDLAAWVKRHGPFPPERAVNLVLQAAQGLKAAHAEGIVHRDIKPANLLLDRKGTVKILDMGLARIDAAPDEETQAALTQDGTVMGTVDYMAPEQARDSKTADARADIYSLGCTLYYLLTGKPVYRGETLMAKLVAHRTRPVPSLADVCPSAPAELDAVLQRMLAKEVADRYQSMGEVISDLRPLDGGQGPTENTQQFAAEETHTGLTDFLHEMAFEQPRPLAARSAAAPAASRAQWLANNKRLVSIAAGVTGAVLLAVAMLISRLANSGARIVAEDRSEAKQSIWQQPPGRTQFGVLAFQTPGFDDWTRQVAAMPADEQVAAVAEKLRELNPKFDGSIKHHIEQGVVTSIEFLSDEIVDISPVRALAGLKSLVCRGTYTTQANGKLADLSPLAGMTLVDLRCGCNPFGDLTPLRGMPLTWFECENCKNLVDLAPLAGMRLMLLQCFATGVKDLSPLRGMPLGWLYCSNGQVSDLSPLAGMPLTSLNCGSTQVADLSPLADMPLTTLHCGDTLATDLTPLAGLPLKSLACDFLPFRDQELLRSLTTLETINNKPAAEFWQEVDQRQAEFDAWLRDVAALPPEEQVAAVTQKLKDFNPGFDGAVTHVIRDGAVTSLEFVTDSVTDISPVRALEQLTSLSCSGGAQRKGRLSDLSPIKGMRLTMLHCNGTRVFDLSPIAGMPLTNLGCDYTQVADLSPLRRMSLTRLAVDATLVSDLSPLEGMPLAGLGCYGTPIADLTPLRGMPLGWVNCSGTRVSDLTPLQESPLGGLQCNQCAIEDFSPLRDLPLASITCDYQPWRDDAALRAIKSLKHINGQSAEDFWKARNAFEEWSQKTAGLTADKQVKAVSKKLKELNPNFDGTLKPTVDNGAITELQFMTDDVTDISPVRALPELRRLNCSGSTFEKSKLADLWPLYGLPLTELLFNFTKVAELSPLRGMRLSRVDFDAAPIADLSPLVGMPLTHLNIRSTQVTDLSLLTDMNLKRLDMAATKITDMSPLRGMAIESLCVHWSTVADLSPLAGMPLNDIVCFDSGVRDLSPLRGAPLQIIWCDFHYYRDAELLRSFTTLESINNKPAAEFWKNVDAKQAAFDAWAKLVATLPAEEQVAAVAEKLKELNPGFDGKIHEQSIVSGVVTGLAFVTDHVDDISPVRALVGLRHLQCGGGGTRGTLQNLWPLRGMSLIDLWINDTQVNDVAPLQGMPLEDLRFSRTPIKDISALRGMQLRILNCDGSLVSDLAPLAGMPLEFLNCQGTAVTDLSPIADTRLIDLYCKGAQIIDLKPIAQLKVVNLTCDYEHRRDAETLRSMTTLKNINDQLTAEFWMSAEAQDREKPR